MLFLIYILLFTDQKKKKKNFHLLMFNKIVIKILPRICFPLKTFVFINSEGKKGYKIAISK